MINYQLFLACGLGDENQAPQVFITKLHPQSLPLNEVIY